MKREKNRRRQSHLLSQTHETYWDFYWITLQMTFSYTLNGIKIRNRVILLRKLQSLENVRQSKLCIMCLLKVKTEISKWIAKKSYKIISRREENCLRKVSHTNWTVPYSIRRILYSLAKYNISRFQNKTRAFSFFREIFLNMNSIFKAYGSLCGRRSMAGC